MSDPMFSVGEDVLLVTPSGKYDGETRVEAVTWSKIDCSVCGARSHFIYSLGIVGPSQTTEWTECVLRKRPPPDEEFQRFMDRLNLPVETKQGEHV